MDDKFFSTSETVSSNRILYTPSKFARESLIYLQEVGELTALDAHTSKRNNLDSYLCFYVVTGNGKLTYARKEYGMYTGDCAFINCSREYSHKTDIKDLWTLRWVHFYGSAVPAIFEKYRERGGRPVFHAVTSDAIKETLVEILAVAASNDYIRDMRINEKLSILLTKIMEESWHPEDISQSSKHNDLAAVKGYLDDNYCNRITLEQLAAKFYINIYYLTCTFKEQFGIMINSYIATKRITVAKRLLRFSDKSIEEIATECGFEDYRYFGRIFKKMEGCTPSTYKKKW